MDGVFKWAPTYTSLGQTLNLALPQFHHLQSEDNCLHPAGSLQVCLLNCLQCLHRMDTQFTAAVNSV
jgi:hypothetical protein